MSKTIRQLGSKIDPSRKYGVIYTIYDPPNTDSNKQLGLLPNGTVTAVGWEFGVAWRYTVLEAELVVKAINAVFEDTEEGRRRMNFCSAMTVRHEKAVSAILEACALFGPAFMRRLDRRNANRGKSLAQRILES
jgi:hypothetical protein